MKLAMSFALIFALICSYFQIYILLTKYWGLQKEIEVEKRAATAGRPGQCYTYSHTFAHYNLCFTYLCALVNASHKLFYTYSHTFATVLLVTYNAAQYTVVKHL